MYVIGKYFFYKIQIDAILYPDGAPLGDLLSVTVTIAKSDYPNGKFIFQGPGEISIANPEQLQTVTLIIERTEGLLGQQQVSSSQNTTDLQTVGGELIASVLATDDLCCTVFIVC